MSGIIIGRKSETSYRVGIVIFHPHYTPVQLTRKSNRYIPTEAAYAVPQWPLEASVVIRIQAVVILDYVFCMAIMHSG